MGTPTSSVKMGIKQDITIVRLDEHACPACGSSSRWDRIEAFEVPSNNPAIEVRCDCGLGELRIIVE